MNPENSENPELQPPVHDPEDMLKPDAPDFVEVPDVAPLSGEHEPLPLWLYLVCGFFLFLAGSSFTGFSIFGSGLIDAGPGGPTIATGATEEVKVTNPILLGQKVYSNNCANCHHADGNGQPGVYPPMGGSEYVVGSKERLAAIMLHGISGPLTVKGGSYGSAQMPGWGTALTPDKIAQVMTYIRATWGNTSNAVTEDEVTAAQAKFASQSGAYSEADLMKIAPNGPDPSDKK